MSKTIELIQKEVDSFNQNIKDSLDGKNITNTGTAKNSLRIEFGEDFVRSIGIFYLEFLDTGRGKGKFPPVNKIRNWVKTKLGITEETQLNQVTFLVSRKIAKLGTEIFLNPNKGIQLDKKITELRNNINSKIGTAAKADVLQKLDKFKKIRKLKLQI